MKKVYGIDNAKFRQLALGVQYQALDTGKVDTANIFTTDAQLASGKYTVLKDPKGVFGFQNVSFVIDKNKLAALGGDQFMAVINSVNKLLTTDAITAMNKAVAIDKQDEATVAKQFLTANKLDVSRVRRSGGRSAGPRPVDARATSTGATISRSVACGPSASIAVQQEAGRQLGDAVDVPHRRGQRRREQARDRVVAEARDGDVAGDRQPQLGARGVDAVGDRVRQAQHGGRALVAAPAARGPAGASR